MESAGAPFTSMHEPDSSGQNQHAQDDQSDFGAQERIIVVAEKIHE
jgi:hypothetical protein